MSSETRAAGAPAAPRGLIDRVGVAAPALFVVLWSTGFIFTKMAAAHADPMAFLAVRCALATLLLGALGFAAGAPWPPRNMILKVAVSGLLIQACYLGGVTEGIRHGLSASIAAMVVALQPLLTGALAGFVLGERVRRLQWCGLALGLVGVAMVLGDKAAAGTGTPASVAMVGGSLLAITIGTLFQKRYGGGGDLRTITAVQYFTSAIAVTTVGYFFEPMRIDWTPDFVLALVWLVVVLSTVTILLYYQLLRRGQASRVASLMYLVPPVTALFAYGLFGENMGPMAVGGMVVVAVGVALANR